MNLAAKSQNANKVTKEWIQEMSNVVDNQFKVMGDKLNTEWQKGGDSFMDKSVQINADTILENVQLVIK